MRKKNNNENPKNDVDDELDRALELQDLIHHKCKMRDDSKKKQEEWDKKFS